jgi:hypothetical protein
VTHNKMIGGDGDGDLSSDGEKSDNHSSVVAVTDQPAHSINKR